MATSIAGTHFQNLFLSGRGRSRVGNGVPHFLVALLSLVLLLSGNVFADPPPVVIPSEGTGKGWTTSKFGDGYITRGPKGESYTTSKFGNGWVTRGSNGQEWTTSKFGDGAITRGPKGESYTTSKFGSGTVTRGPDQREWTTSKFGQGTITRGPGGQSYTTDKFGSGYSTSKASGGAVLVLPPPANKR